MNKAREFAEFMTMGFEKGLNIRGAVNSGKLRNNPYYDLMVCEANQKMPTLLRKDFFDEALSYLDKIMVEHDFRFVQTHILRVRNFAVQIATPDSDMSSLEIACLIHDIGKPFGENHAIKGAEIARGWLIQKKVQKLEKIAEWISEHNSTPTSMESKLLFDADKLDKIGISGVCLLLAKAHLKNMTMEELVKLYSSDDEIPHFFGKHKIQSDYFHTENAKKLAPDRIRVMDTFFRELRA